MGVIGRTGSGKSTLTLGLLRILEVFEEQEVYFARFIIYMHICYAFILI